MTFYGDMQKLTSSLLTTFTQADPAAPPVLTHFMPGNGPPENPGAPTEQKITLPAIAVRGVAYKYVVKELAISSDQQATIPAMTPEPMIGDRLTADGVNYKVMQIDRIPSIGTLVAIVLILRAGA